MKCQEVDALSMRSYKNVAQLINLLHCCSSFLLDLFELLSTVAQ